MRVLFLFPVFLFCACGGDGSDSSNDVPPSNVLRDIQCVSDVTAGLPKGGYFVGEIATEDAGSYAEAILTEDGQVRIYIAPLGEGVPSYQFIGSTSFKNDLGYGNLRAENCSGKNPFCYAGGAYLELDALCGGELAGTIYWDPWSTPEATPFDGPLTFTFEWPTETYLSPATTAFAAGSYPEQLVFKVPGDVVISVDSTGAMFFQSASTGCIGNGSLTPHLTGSFNAYDVELTMANCGGDFSHLNTTLFGLATRSVGDWQVGAPVWGDWLVLWLSTPETLYGHGTDPAVTMWGGEGF